MERTRGTWTDRRFDDFALRVDRRLDRIDEQARWEHDERERRRWYESQQRFEFGIRAMFWGLGVTFGVALALIVFQLAGRA